MPNPRTVHVDPTAAGPEISPFLFGHNLEHTRRAMWQGLSAQLLANRKFAGEVFSRGTEGSPAPGRGPVSPDGVVAGWFGVGGPAVRFAHDTSTGYAGNESQKVTLDPGVTGGIAQRSIALRKNAPYDFKVFAKADRACNASLRITDAAGHTVYAQQKFDISAGDWCEWRHTFSISVTDENCQLEIILEGPATAWIGVTSLLPSDHFLGLRRDVVELLREMSVPMLRWPGGNFTLDYRWQDGLLPVDQRPTIKASMSEVLPHSNSCDFHEIGIDEFIALCRHLNAEPFLTANVRPQDIGTVEDAAAWVEYCNGTPETKWGSVRSQRGHPDPYRVKYWSIGNELWGGHMLQSHSDAHVYAQRVADYAPAMRKVDPSILLTAVGIPAPVWDAIVVKEAGQYFDFLSGHEYVKPEGYELADYARLTDAASIRVLEKIKEWRKLIDKNAPAGKHIGMAFDEFNIWHLWFAAPFEHEWKVGPVDGGFMAALLNLFCREFQSLGLSLAALFQPVNEGAIFVGPLTSFLTPMGQVYKLFRAHHGQCLVPIENADGLDLCASRSPSGDRVNVTAVSHNSGNGTDQVVTLQLPSGVRNAKVVMLSAKTTTPNSVFQEHTEGLTVSEGKIAFKIPALGMALVTIEL